MEATKKRLFASQSGLIAKAVQQHFLESEEKQRGHMQKRSTGLRLTEVKMSTERNPTREYKSDDEEEDENSKEADARFKKKHKDIFVWVIVIQDELPVKIYTNRTGKFPVRSSQGNQYLMIMCEMDSDTIIMKPMRDRTAGEMIETYQKMVDRLNACGIHQRHQVLEE